MRRAAVRASSSVDVPRECSSASSRVVGVVGFENGAEEIVLVSEMVIERTQGDPGIFGDLAHGGAVKTLQQKKTVRHGNDFGARAGRGGSGWGIRTVVHAPYSTGEHQILQ